MPDSTEVDDFEQLGVSSHDSELSENRELVATPTKKPGWKKWLRRLLIAAFVFVALLVAGVFLLFQLASVEPEFYKQAMNVDVEVQKKNGSEMEGKILDLRNSILGSESWSASFTEDQLNGWLAWDLQKKFPRLMPPEVTDPRVKLGEQSVTLAFRCDVKPLRGIVIVEADIFTTAVINQIGIRIKSIHSGMVPIPLAAFADAIAKQATDSNLEIEWVTEDGDPVALVDLPETLTRPMGVDLLELQQLEISKKKISLAGVMHPQDF